MDIDRQILKDALKWFGRLVVWDAAVILGCILFIIVMIWVVLPGGDWIFRP